jgi:hypothetical protein
MDESLILFFWLVGVKDWTKGLSHAKHTLYYEQYLGPLNFLW